MTISFTPVDLSFSPVIYCCSEIGVFVSYLLFFLLIFYNYFFETKAEMLLNQQVLFRWVKRGFRAPWVKWWGT